ncbi:hypothetical protein VPH35_055512 [Triticum aestivum]|uniref:Uncharacterized protein n=1 Tax=Triticum aestivum TaxID=4565 RepID=A0A077S7H2_WHEAT|nr:unnamed protein product [Triticum aestivum]
MELGRMARQAQLAFGLMKNKSVQLIQKLFSELHFAQANDTQFFRSIISKNTRRRWPGSVSAPSDAAHGPASKCVYAPATHAGSSECRFHRTNSQGHGHGQGHGQGSHPSSPPSPAAANVVPRHPASLSSSSGTVATQ